MQQRHLPVQCTCWCLELSTGCNLSVCSLQISHTAAASLLA